MIRLGGLAFEISGAPATPLETEWLGRHAAPAHEAADVVVTLVEAGAFTPRCDPASQEPPPMFWEDGRLELLLPHARAVIDVAGRAVRVERPVTEGAALDTVLRVALSCLLPYRDGVLLHAAAIPGDRGTLLFHGPSGAGKSTIASLAPTPALGDEHVAVRGPAPHMATPLVLPWKARKSPVSTPVRALLKLDKGARYRLTTLEPGAAVRSLLPALLVPPSATPVWERAIGVLADIAAVVPAYQMTWHLDEPPWERLAEAGLL